MPNPFANTVISLLKDFFIQNFNAGPKKKDCITTLNHAMKMLYPYIKKLGSQIDKTMMILKDKGHVENQIVIEFLSSSGKVTTGVTKPHTLGKSVWDTLHHMSGSGFGQFIFTLSVMDGYHSVTLILNKDKKGSVVFWCDQTKGCEKMTKKDLDSYIAAKTIYWWEGVLNKSKRKMKTRATIWLLKS